MKKLLIGLLVITSFSTYALPGDPEIDPATRSLKNTYDNATPISVETAMEDLKIGQYWRCSRYTAFGDAQEEHTFNIVFIKKGQVYHAFGDSLSNGINPRFFGFDNNDLKAFNTDSSGSYKHTVRVDQGGSLITLWQKNEKPYYISCQLAQ